MDGDCLLTEAVASGKLRLRWVYRIAVVGGDRDQKADDLLDQLDRTPRVIATACEGGHGTGEQSAEQQGCNDTAHSSPPDPAQSRVFWLLIGGRAPVQEVVIGKVR